MMFIVNGAVDLEITKRDGSLIELETLQQGDFIGQYAVLFDTNLIFRVVAKTHGVRVLTLTSKFFADNGDTDRIPYLK